MPPRFTLRIGNHLQTPAAKRYYNTHLFAEVAPRYDFITRALSFGRDAAWKRDLIAALPGLEAPVCLDLACGTGDLTLALARRYPHGTIVGLDITADMLAIAVRRTAASQAGFVLQDMGLLGLGDGTVDVVTGGYALRNAPDLDQALSEIARVLKPGGLAAFLDFSKPADAAWQRLECGLLRCWMNFWGLLVHRNAEVYGYIVESLKTFPDRRQFRERLARQGLAVKGSRRYFAGVMELVVVRRASA